MKITPVAPKVEEPAPVTEEITPSLTPSQIPAAEETAPVEETAVPTEEETAVEPAPVPEPEPETVSVEEKSAPAVEEAVAEEKPEDSLSTEESVAAEAEVVGKIKKYFNKISDQRFSFIYIYIIHIKRCYQWGHTRKVDSERKLALGLLFDTCFCLSRFVQGNGYRSRT